MKIFFVKEYPLREAVPVVSENLIKVVEKFPNAISIVEAYTKVLIIN